MRNVDLPVEQTTSSPAYLFFHLEYIDIYMYRYKLTFGVDNV